MNPKKHITLKHITLKNNPKKSPASALPGRELIQWYKKNHRSLPWRGTKDPYKIWVSEVMLQQTTVNTVIPHYKKFIKKFKTLKCLAQAPLAEVLPYWSGLGYYSRVKNLHKSAQVIYAKKHFPQTYKELIKLTGFGPYTARAVSSLAFDEKTGVLDANVIRVLARYTGFKQVWWNKKGRDFLQAQADLWAIKGEAPSSLMNQALMELGALLCSASNPLCSVCPLKTSCQAFKMGWTDIIPLAKKQKSKEIWVYRPVVFTSNNHIALVCKHALPVLKNYPAFPGRAFSQNTPPTRYDFVHFITHHAIYVIIDRSGQKKVLRQKPSYFLKNKLLWVKTRALKAQNPSSLMQKILFYGHG